MSTHTENTKTYSKLKNPKKLRFGIDKPKANTANHCEPLYLEITTCSQQVPSFPSSVIGPFGPGCTCCKASMQWEGQSACVQMSGLCQKFCPCPQVLVSSKQVASRPWVINPHAHKFFFPVGGLVWPIGPRFFSGLEASFRTFPSLQPGSLPMPHRFVSFACPISISPLGLMDKASDV